MKKLSPWQRVKNVFLDPDHREYIEVEEYVEVDNSWDNDDNITNINDYREGRSKVSKNSDTIALSPKRSFDGDFMHDSPANPGNHIVKSEPKSINQAADIGNLIKQGKIVAIQMEGVTTSECQRIMDFLGGVAYATGGQIDELSSRIFIIAPKGVDVSEQHMEQLKANGIEFNSKNRRRNRA